MKSLRRVDFSHPTGHYIWTFLLASPLRKSWVRPCPPRPSDNDADPNPDVFRSHADPTLDDSGSHGGTRKTRRQSRLQGLTFSRTWPLTIQVRLEAGLLSEVTQLALMTSPARAVSGALTETRFGATVTQRGGRRSGEGHPVPSLYWFGRVTSPSLAVSGGEVAAVAGTSGWPSVDCRWYHDDNERSSVPRSSSRRAEP